MKAENREIRREIYSLQDEVAKLEAKVINFFPNKLFNSLLKLKKKMHDVVGSKVDGVTLNFKIHFTLKFVI